MLVSEQTALLDNVLLSIQEIPGARAHHSTGWTAFHTTVWTESCIFQTSSVSIAFKDISKAS